MTEWPPMEPGPFKTPIRGLSFEVMQGNVLVLAPPLVVADGEFDQALDIVEQSLRG